MATSISGDAGDRLKHTTARQHAVDKVSSGALLGMLGLALTLRLVWLVLAVVRGGAPIDNEGAEYARLADNLHAGLGYLGLHGAFQPHDPPLYSLLMALLVPFAGSAELAGRIVSLAAGVLLVVPVYVLARYAYGGLAAACAAFVIAVHPFLVELSTAVLSESLFVTLAMSGLALLLTTLRTGSWRMALCTGVTFGLACLTRQEGLAWSAVAVAVAFGATWWSTRRAGRAIWFALAVALPIVLLPAPYWAIDAQQTGHFAPFNKSAGLWATDQRMMAGMSYAEASLLLGPQLEPLGPELYDYDVRNASVAPHGIGETRALVSFAAWPLARLIFWNLRQPAFGSIALIALAAVGLLAPPWRRRWPYDALFLLMVALVFAALVPTPLFEQRYLTSFVPFVALWGGRGVALLVDALGRTTKRLALERILPPAIIGVAAAAALAILLTVTDADRAGAVARAGTADRDAGAWIARNVPAPSVMDERTAISYYAHARRWINFPWGDSALVMRYIDRQQPNVLVLSDPPAMPLPYLSDWVRDGVPDPAACLATVIRASDRTLYIYLRRSSAASGAQRSAHDGCRSRVTL
jgi:4-amino-4-deoxy-L-arabinose transferase-like glycosyltransferase